MDAATLLALPSSPAPSGLQTFAIFVNFFFPALALVVVSIRVAGRVVASQFALDDWLVCVAMLLSIGETAISFFFIKTNFVGIPLDRVPPHDPTEGLIWLYAVQILYNPILALVRASVLIFLTRLFGQKHRVRQFLLWLNAANIAQMVGTFFAVILQCLPIPFNWDPTISGGRCVNRPVLYTTTAVFNIVFDLVILGLPLWIFASLNIPRRAKIALSFVFLLGFLVTITSVIRLVLLVQGLFNIVIFSSSTGNVGFITSIIETNLALITASAPALRPIFRSRARGGWFSRTVVATSRGADDNADIENGQLQKPIGWEPSSSSSSSPSTSPPIIGSGVGGKFGRGGSHHRGGRGNKGRNALLRSSSPSSSRGGGRNKIRPIIRVRTDLAEVRSQSPRTSEEQTMTSNGAMRVSDIQREINGIVKDIAVAGAGSYTGRGGGGGGGGGGGERATGRRSASRSRSSSSSPKRWSPSFPPPRTPKMPLTTPARPRPSMESITIGARVMAPPRPSTSESGVGVPAAAVWPRPSMEAEGITVGARAVSRHPPPRRPSTSGSGGRRVGGAPPERFYSGSIYPDQEGFGGYGSDEDDDDYGVEVSVSRDGYGSGYGERRFGVVTPKGTTPTRRAWEGSGRPF